MTIWKPYSSVNGLDRDAPVIRSPTAADVVWPALGLEGSPEEP